MLSHDFHVKLQKFRDNADRHEPFTLAVERLAARYADIYEPICRLAEGGDRHTQASNRVQQAFTTLHQTTAEISPRALYRSLDLLRSDLDELLQPNLAKSALAQTLFESLETFSHLYDSFLSSPSPSAAAPLILQANTLHRLITNTHNGLQFADEVCAPNSHPTSAESDFSLALYQPTSYADLVEKLIAFGTIYDELCQLLSVSQVDFPLRIVRIESGSLWIKVFGETRVIQLVTSIVESSIGFLHRKFTDEGKIASIPRKIESLNAVIQLTEKLAAMGVNTNDVEENLRKSAVSISQSLACLLEGQARISLNQSTMSVGDRIEPLMISQRETLLLQQGDKVDPPLPPL